MRRVWRDDRELELSLGASISVHCVPSYRCRITGTVSMFAARVALPATPSKRRTGKWHPRSRRQELLALGLRGILVLDAGNRISGFAKSNQHSFGEMNTFFVIFRDLVPRRACPELG